MDFVGFTIIATLLLAYSEIKSRIVHKAHLKAINLIYRRDDWMSLTRLISPVRYSSHVWDPRKWTFHQMFPELSLARGLREAIFTNHKDL